MKNRTLKPVLTEDGSFTLHFEELNEHYHSKDGAQSESEYVYIKNGLERVYKSPKIPLRIFEIGLGTGMNAILSYQWAKLHGTALEYWSIDPYPIDEKNLNFLLANTSLFKDNKEIFDQIHFNHQAKKTDEGEFFNYNFEKVSIQKFDAVSHQNYFDVIFFDAFAPSKQSEMWDFDVMKKCFDLLKQGGVLSSYCASGQFKRSLISAGFELIKEKGFSKKREMFIGIKKAPI